MMRHRTVGEALRLTFRLRWEVNYAKVRSNGQHRPFIDWKDALNQFAIQYGSDLDLLS